MINKLSKFGVLIFAFGFASVLTSKAQTNACNLQFKVFSYNSISSEKSLKDVEVTLTNLKNKEKKFLTVSPTSVFKNLTEGSYQIKVAKNGYKDKKKEIKLECAFADKDDIFREYIYLWKDESSSGDENDLHENNSETKNSTEPVMNSQTESISQSENPDDKSGQRKSRASGKVTVRVLIDVDGNVVSAKAIDGNSLFADSAVKAARKAKFAPTMLAGNPVQVTGNLVYNFVP